MLSFNLTNWWLNFNLLAIGVLGYVYMGLVPNDPNGLLFTQDHSGTGPERVQTDPKLDLLFYSSNFGSIWIHPGPVP